MKLSIITINYNNAIGLRKTMESVFAQTYRDFEYIVVDGASTDGSVDVIREFDSFNVQRSTFSAFTWVSEPDTGIYNAMNKGIQIAAGTRMVDSFNRSELVEDKNKGIRAANEEYVLMLNSGDYLVDEHVIERILPELDGTDIVQGNTIEDHNGTLYRKRGYGRSEIDFIDAVEVNFLHQASFIKRFLHERYGLYDDSYKRSADSYFYIKCLALGDASFKYVDIDISNFDIHGLSSIHDELEITEDNRWFRENMSIRLLEMERDVMKRNKIYKSLRSNRLIWKLVLCLARIADYISSPPQYVKKEKIR